MNFSISSPGSAPTLASADEGSGNARVRRSLPAGGRHRGAAPTSAGRTRDGACRPAAQGTAELNQGGRCAGGQADVENTSGGAGVGPGEAAIAASAPAAV